MKISGKELVVGRGIWVEKSGGTGCSDDSDGSVKVQAFLKKVGTGRYNLLIDGNYIDLMDCGE